MSHLMNSDWNEFEDKYQRVRKASEKLFRIEMDDSLVKEDLDNFKRLRCIAI